LKNQSILAKEIMNRNVLPPLFPHMILFKKFHSKLLQSTCCWNS